MGQIASLCDDGINVNFLRKRKDGTYKWPRPKDTDLVSTKYIFCCSPRAQKVRSSFGVYNEDSVINIYNSYKKIFGTFFPLINEDIFSSSIPFLIYLHVQMVL